MCGDVWCPPGGGRGGGGGGHHSTRSEVIHPLRVGTSWHSPSLARLVAAEPGGQPKLNALQDRKKVCAEALGRGGRRTGGKGPFKEGERTSLGPGRAAAS